MKRLNVVKGVVSGGDGDRLAAAIQWRDADPERIIAAAGVRGSADIPLPPVDVLRAAFTDGRLRVLGEVTAQYAGLSLSDPTYTPYLALAEELDVPVSVHMGLGQPGISFDPCCRGFRAALGNPMVLEEALNPHPKMRLNVMHGLAGRDRDGRGRRRIGALPVASREARHFLRQRDALLPFGAGAVATAGRRRRSSRGGSSP
jgi:predicted TIM-barrel fold metal-dependent hydrolase